LLVAACWLSSYYIVSRIFQRFNEQYIFTM